MEEELTKGAKELGIELSNCMIKKFKTYYSELLLWNKKINLVSRGDEKIIVRRHFLDSLNAVQFIPTSASVLDIGSGAGFPGVPIKIVRPNIKLDLLEPKLKRFNFLTHLANILSLEVGIYRSRVEEFSFSQDSANKYKVVLSRSVGKLKWLTKVAVPILADDGIIITYKGSRLWDEFKELQVQKVHLWEIKHRNPRTFCAGTIVVLKRNESNS